MSEQELQTETMADYEDQFDVANPWNIVTRYMEEGKNLLVKVEGIVNGGAIAYIEGLRGFIPVSRLSLSYVENVESYLLKEIEVRVIEVNQVENKLVLSAKEILKEKENEEKKQRLREVEVGSILDGTVESIQTYGAFVRLQNNLSGLVHISQISDKRIKSPKDVLAVGDTVTVKVIGIKDGKISLSMKALIEPEEEVIEEVEIPETEEIGTSLGDLFKNIQL
ncbi:S1 RNA-binding domain-containing protein [Faecalimonas sp.]